VAERHFTDLECRSTVYVTPPLIVDRVTDYYGGQIPLDPATEPGNPANAAYFCTKETADVFEVGVPSNWRHDGLSICWSDYDGVFLNPPYGKEIRHWCRKIHEESLSGASIIALLPAGARFGTGYFQDFIFSPALDVACFMRGRVKFLRPDGAVTTGQNPYDSVLYGFNVDVERFAKIFSQPCRNSKGKLKEFGKVIYMEVMC